MKPKKQTFIIGIDEVGRGSLAGPVTVCALTLPRNLDTVLRRLKLPAPLRDSKKLTKKQREKWTKWIKREKRILYKTVSIGSRIIDKINISAAANLAATRALKKLTIDNKRLTIKKTKIFLDGGLYLKPPAAESRWLAATVVRGDEKILSISLASIVAKVHRDKLMAGYHKKQPQYGFARHKGYGTLEHRKAIKKYGFSPIHRLTFIGKYARIKKLNSHGWRTGKTSF